MINGTAQGLDVNVYVPKDRRPGEEGDGVTSVRFDKPYVIKSIEAGDDEIVLRAAERGVADVPFD